MSNKKPPVSPGGNEREETSLHGKEYSLSHDSSITATGQPPEGRSAAGAPAHLGYVRISGQNDNQHTGPVVTIHPHGTIIAEGGRVVSKPAKSGGKRSKIKTFSSQSRTRLRQKLAVSNGPDGWEPIGMTATIPGEPISEEKYRYLWHVFRHKIPAVPVIWRVELQQRKQPHVHLVAWLPKDGQGARWKAELMLAWWHGVKRLGPHEYKTNGKQYSCTSRMAMPGAYEHCVSFDDLEVADDFGWWRYLASHTGKSKQAQMGWVGRNWGVLNEDILSSSKGVPYNLTIKQWFRMRRYLRRLTTFQGAGSGRRSIWYVKPDTIKAMIALVTAL